MWLQPINAAYEDGKHFLQMFTGKVNMMAQQHGIEGETLEAIKAKIVQNYDDLSGANTTDLKTFQIQVIVARKE